VKLKDHQRRRGRCRVRSRRPAARQQRAGGFATATALLEGRFHGPDYSPAWRKRKLCARPRSTASMPPRPDRRTGPSRRKEMGEDGKGGRDKALVTRVPESERFGHHRSHLQGTSGVPGGPAATRSPRTPRLLTDGKPDLHRLGVSAGNHFPVHVRGAVCSSRSWTFDADRTPGPATKVKVRIKNEARRRRNRRTGRDASHTAASSPARYLLKPGREADAGQT